MIETEVVSIRIDPIVKKKLQAIADKECRSFADQCRMVLGAWVKKHGGVVVTTYYPDNKR